ncbi:hypothetical protein [Arthrobacter sp. ES3-54]|uniref:hypothetical protein n=1 Tax=Arthrobacter sp. ES3-54 TaxID=1502991 RepID=UPI0024051FE9|nr:hypothetical protein [Arthrobacter sp. ES3-54]MDF9750447.1 uncharacterized protein YfcZ (UPF0381/DUF406 family) [Arthrobacter sp. ES3-54]
MSEHSGPGPAPGGTGRARETGHFVRVENLTTQQMRTIGKRRADAEEKLAHHLEQARHPAGEQHPTTADAADH